MSWLRPLSTVFDFYIPDAPQTQQKPRIVVAGYGWGTHAFLQHISRNDFTIKVVSERPLRLNQNQMIGSLWPTYTIPLYEVQQDTCIAVDKAKKRLHCKNGKYPYDYLVVATGSEANDFGIKGVKEYCTMCKTDEDIQTIRTNIKDEAIILGAGPTGLELACSLLKRGVKQVDIVEGADFLLPGFSDTFRQRAYQHLLRKGIRFHFSHGIQKIEANAIVTSKATISYNPSHLLVWTCGIRPVEFVRGIEPKGVIVGPNLNYTSDIYVIGDACKNMGPPTAQNARQQGQYLAEYFNAKFAPKKPYVFQELGRCLDVGDGFLFEVRGFVFFMHHLDWRELSF